MNEIYIELGDIDYLYEFNTLSFKEFNYSLNLTLQQEPKEKIESKIIGCFKGLEEILDSVLSGETISKAQICFISSLDTQRKILFGYKYMDNSKIIPSLILTLNFNFVKEGGILKYVYGYIKHGYMEEKKERILKIFDRIVKDPGIIISEQAKKKIKEINKLREDNLNHVSLDKLLTG